MTNNELKEYRVKLFRDASMMTRKPDRIPHFSQAFTWKIFDAGYKLSQALNDYELMEKIVREHQERYCFDAMGDYGTRNAYRVSAALGRSIYHIDDEKDAIYYEDEFFCSHEELAKMKSEPNKFMYEVMMTRKFKDFNPDMTAEQFQRVIDERLAYVAYVGHINKVMSEDYGLPSVCAPNPSVLMPTDNLFNIVRGIKGFSRDMHTPEYLLEVMDSMAETLFNPGIEKLKVVDKGPNMSFCFDYMLFLMCHTIMNRKQFEMFYFPYIKKILDTLQDREKTCKLYIQGKLENFFDFFADYPKGQLTFHLETDDPFVTRKKLPNVAIIGNMPTQMLGYYDAQSCVDYAKKMCDELSVDGGFMMSQDKMLTYKHDAKRENLLAVCDFIREYK